MVTVRQVSRLQPEVESYSISVALCHPPATCLSFLANASDEKLGPCLMTQ